METVEFGMGSSEGLILTFHVAPFSLAHAENPHTALNACYAAAYHVLGGTIPYHNRDVGCFGPPSIAALGQRHLTFYADFLSLKVNQACPVVSLAQIYLCSLFRRCHCRFWSQEWGSDMTLDVSDRDGADEEGAINLQSWPTVRGMYMPDAITTFKAQGRRCECPFCAHASLLAERQTHRKLPHRTFLIVGCADRRPPPSCLYVPTTFSSTHNYSPNFLRAVNAPTAAARAIDTVLHSRGHEAFNPSK